ncbi:hypothetical protein POX_a00465 [Penicillium oxalicum]|uniref:Uncharacterized protein n=1 Tax=Penicillium oxalicum (strain 114-2 / CGMCC 5302) TaxID=933388 RepID=S8BHC9_PENO1|nr:hypothetical protein POX_a00465 [Penicillium oxalicum]EPS34562.1 hypothetical protein PDE_09526 [Penicillium oxalicum 114-2]KAI2793877.1 hypothetical protein POX_a00465 [Penicillium oxalicum]
MRLWRPFHSNVSYYAAYNTFFPNLCLWRRLWPVLMNIISITPSWLVSSCSCLLTCALFVLLFGLFMPEERYPSLPFDVITRLSQNQTPSSSSPLVVFDKFNGTRRFFTTYVLSKVRLVFFCL